MLLTNPSIAHNATIPRRGDTDHSVSSVIPLLSALFSSQPSLSRYADLHCYFAAPSPRPFLHRFDKACYFYIYYNSTRQASRIEVAINPGTPDQAAFNGFLDNVKIANSHTFPTLVTLVVDGNDQPSKASPTSARAGRDPDEWRLPSADPRDPGTKKYRIHTIDIYFWAQDDARLIVDIFKRLLQPHQLDIDPATDEVHQEPGHHDIVSPVVQNLEHVAISDPAYRKEKPHDTAPGQGPEGVSLPPAPPPTDQGPMHGQAPPPASATTPDSANVERKSSVKGPAPSTDYTPLAYNPAAPAAPEPIAHREDTPPPVDAADGTGLAAAAAHDHGYAHQQHAQSFSSAPGLQPSTYGHYGNPAQPPSFGPQASQISPRTSVSTSFGPQPTSATNPDGSRHPSIAAQTYAPNPQDPNAHIFGQQSVQSPGAQFYTSINGQPHKPLQHVQPQYADYLSAGKPAPPVGGYSNYQYGQPQPSATTGSPYDIHSQVYRPTESEHHAHHHKPSRSSSQGHKPSQTEKIERGVGKFLKKIEKKIG